MTALGFDIVREIDLLFLEVSLPDGWCKERDVHQGWWRVYDGKHRLRCQCMEGHANYPTVVADWLGRYTYDLQWHPYELNRLRYLVLDGGSILRESEWATVKPERVAQLGLAYVRQATQYLNTQYPQWRNVLAYW